MSVKFREKKLGIKRRRSSLPLTMNAGKSRIKITSDIIESNRKGTKRENAVIEDIDEYRERQKMSLPENTYHFSYTN